MMTYDNLTISILIPVYNVEVYVVKCIESILAQIDDRAIIILMNDASTDNSLEVITRYQDHSQIKIINASHNRGLSATRNAMLQVAESDYIWFIDSDDVMYEGAYGAVMAHIESLGTDIVCADYVSLRHKNGADKEVRKKAFIGPSNQFFTNYNNSFIDNIIKNNSNHVWNKIFRKNVIKDIGFKEGVNFEDIYYMTDISKKSFSYSYLNKPVIKYREREGSIVKTLNQKYVDDYINGFIYRLENYPIIEKNGSTSAYNYLLYKSFKRYVGLIVKINVNNQLDLLNYTYSKYHQYFIGLYKEAKNELPIHKRLTLNSKHSIYKKITRILERKYGQGS